MTDTRALTADHQHFENPLTEAGAATKEAVFDTLAKADITFVTIYFEGKGDVGQILDIAAYNNDQPVQIPHMTVTAHRAEQGTMPVPFETSLAAALKTLCFDYLSQEDGGWRHDEVAYADFAFHVPERRIELRLYERFTI